MSEDHELREREDKKNAPEIEASEDDDESDWEFPLAFDRPRHLEPVEGVRNIDHSWRLKEKYKTHCVALVLCLNVGVDPPDTVKTQPCARLECWIDPLSLSSTKALESIGHNLQQQYERWQPRARYKQSLDPTSEDVKKLCCSLRRNAKDERVLFHYNGHGVPKPTNQGEIWVFNRAYTQYIPLSVYDLQTWMGAPSLYVYDCSNAGVILEQFKSFAEQHDRDYNVMVKQLKPGDEQPPPSVSFKNCIQLGACAVGQSLPMNPEMPADLFTSCLTTPVKMAMKWFVLRSHTKVTPANVADLIDKIPGQLTDRRTMLGELNWIFTAITDTIAWNSLPPELFQQLFRADLLTASLCRNFLLADRIMRSYNCTPVSSPALPSLAGHPMWQAWDQTLDLALAQLPDMLGKDAAPYTHSPFFKEQLTAFQVWLDLGSPRRPPPDQLPMVLQVLLSTVHRVRALQILCRFLALGAWAVRAVLAVGIFPYMLKLLQASAHDLRAPMVYIWAKIVAVDPSCQADLVNAKGHRYFLSVLQDTSVESEHRTLAAYVLAGIVDNYPPGQEAALQGSLISICLEQLSDPNPLLRQWLAICLGRLWRDYDAARWSGVRDLAHEKLYTLLEEPNPEVRAAATFALGTFVQCGRERSEHANTIDQQVAATIAKRAPIEASHLVRAEILAALQWLVLTFEPHFIAASLQDKSQRASSRERQKSERGGYAVEPGQEALHVVSRSSDHAIRKVPSSSSIPTMTSSLQALPTIGFVSVYTKLWSTLCTMCSDPYPQVQVMGHEIVSYIKNQVLESSLGRDFVEVRSFGGSSSSLPPSPNTRGQHMPHAHNTNTLPTLGSKKVKSHMPNTISEDSASREHHNSLTSSQQSKKPIVSTQYVQWASSQFARCTIDEDWQKDEESRLYQERKWRYNRNKSLRKEAKELLGAGVSRLESQVFYARAPLSPAVIMFHSYDQHIAVASKDNFGIWDWGTGAKLCASVWRGTLGVNTAARVSSMDYVNAHDQSLLAIATATGEVAIFRPTGNGRHKEPQLVTAWSGLDVRPPAGERASEWRPQPTPPLYMGAVAGGVSVAGGVTAGAAVTPAPPPGTLLAWGALDCTLAVAGDSRHLRLWDAQTELKKLDINTDTKAAVTSLARVGASQLVVGFSDGACRVWDARAPKGPAYSHHDHQAALLCARVHTHLYTLVTGCTSGEVRLYDTRKPGAVETVQTAGPMSAMSVHPMHNILACGSANQCISVYNLQGASLNTIRFHEGFMGARIGPVSCLAFHPLRCALAVGTRDSTVSVYSSDARR